MAHLFDMNGYDQLNNETGKNAEVKKITMAK